VGFNMIIKKNIDPLQTRLTFEKSAEERKVAKDRRINVNVLKERSRTCKVSYGFLNSAET
jgi:hypothetical protein